MAAPQLPRDFPDHAIREALIQPRNLRAVLREVAPEIADRLDYTRLEIVKRAYLLDDWRERDNDVLVRLPLLGMPAGTQVLVCILIEHQSSADPVMPLRLLLYAVLHWEREWQLWERQHPRGEPLRLTPILPVVFHTGQRPWNTNRTLADLIAAGECKAWAPQWPTRFYDLADHPAETLLQATEAWWQAMAVVRAEWADRDEFTRVLGEALRHLEPQAQADRVGWQQLIKTMRYWGLFRRPKPEHAEILAPVRGCMANAELQREIETMAEQMQQTWEQELLARGRQVGEAAGEARGELKYCRKMVRKALEKRFGTLPEELLQRIADAELPALEGVLDRADALQSLGEITL
jgi:hypothetical protein